MEFMVSLKFSSTTVSFGNSSRRRGGGKILNTHAANSLCVRNRRHEGVCMGFYHIVARVLPRGPTNTIRGSTEEVQ